MDSQQLMFESTLNKIHAEKKESLAILSSFFNSSNDSSDFYNKDSQLNIFKYIDLISLCDQRLKVLEEYFTNE